MTATGAGRVIVFRADASRDIGSGHVRRMGVLAGKLKAAGAERHLVCNAEALEVYAALPAIFDSVRLAETEDEAVRAAGSPDCVIFDHYGLGRDDERRYRAPGRLLVAIDDLADREHDVDILFDVNFGRDAGAYRDLAPRGCAVHVGPKFQIIRDAFLELREDALRRREARNGAVRSIFVSIGGVDPGGLTLVAAEEALAAAPEATVEIVVGSASRHIADLRRLEARMRPRVRLHIDADNVAELMANSDLAIGAGGTMTWERNCLGLPSIILTLADNQELVAAHMNEVGAATVIDVRAGYREGDVGRAVRRLASDRKELLAMSARAAAQGGFDGAKAIADMVLEGMSPAG